MTKSCLILLALAAQSVCTSGAVVAHLRAQSNSTLSFSQSIWDKSIGHAQREIEMTKAEPPKVNKILYVIFAMVFGVCGCDRCFMGQICLGCLKGFTGGGFLVWHIIDYFVCLANCLSKDKEIDMFGYHATFETKSVEMAFYIAAALFCLNLLQQVNAFSQGRSMAAVQQAQQEQMMAALIKANEQAAQTDIPRRHQSLAYIPTAFTKGLRKAGIVTEKPTIPELIAAFDKMDKDGDGQLDSDEIKEGLLAMGASEEDVAEMIKSADTDGDGKISKNEFLISYSKK